MKRSRLTYYLYLLERDICPFRTRSRPLPEEATEARMKRLGTVPAAF